MNFGNMRQTKTKHHRPVKSIRDLLNHWTACLWSWYIFLEFDFIYLSNRNQRTRIDSFFRSWGDIFSGALQASILGPLLLNIFMCSMFLILKAVYYFTGYADDKWHLLLEQTTLKIGNLQIKNSLCEKLLGINFDYTLNFSKYTEDFCQKPLRKINALARLATKKALF